MNEQGERPTYDVAELRRCIALSFSTRELRELCEGLGALGIGGFDRGIQDAAREVVRHFERQGQLASLVHKLAEAKPLMEWPNAGKPGQTADPVPAFAPAPELMPAPAPAPAPELTPAPAPEPAPAPAPLAGPAPPSFSAPTPGPVLRDPYAAGWPGMQQPSAPKPTVEGRKLTMMLVIGGVVVAIAAVGAFLIGRAGAAKEGPAPLLTGKDAQAKGERPLRESGAARLASDAINRSFGHLVRSCDLSIAPNAKMGAFLFKVAYDECGARPGIARPPSLPLSQNAAAARKDPSAAGLDTQPEPEPTATETPSPPPPRAGGGRTTGPKPVTTPDKAPPSNAADACMSKCASSQKSCTSRCGAEPTSGSGYSSWQSCNSSCLVAVSKCRQACQ